MKRKAPRPAPHEPRRYLGLELSGAKNQKTALAALQFYPREHKIFLLDIYDRIAAHEEQSSDEALLEVIAECAAGAAGADGSAEARMGVNVPLELPPSLLCDCRGCARGRPCTHPGVKWMREATRRAARQKGVKVLDFTPYTQRPVELYMRYQVMPELRDVAQFEIDETLGGNRAPLTARMHYLKRHLGGLPLVEVWPKLTVATLAPQLGITRKTVLAYRHLEQGAPARSEILDALVERQGIFIYERDQRKLAQSLAAFDAFLCAYTALLADLGQCVRPPAGFPVATGWVAYPGRHVRLVTTEGR
jgi:hypothetical protein